MIINSTSPAITQSHWTVSKSAQGSTTSAAGSSGTTAQTDSATLSTAALALAAGDTSTTSSSNWLSTLARSDASQAEQLAYDYAYMNDMPLVDISAACAGTGPVVYCSTGEPVTEASEAAFKAEAAALREGRIALYESEKAKGTAAADILDKVVSYMNTNASADHLSLMQWDRVSGEA